MAGNPDFRLVIGADPESENTISSDLTGIFNKHPVKIRIASDPKSVLDIRNDVSNAFANDPLSIKIRIDPQSIADLQKQVDDILSQAKIKIPIHVENKASGFSSLTKEYKDLATKIPKLKVDTTQYEKALKRLGNMQTKLMKLDPDTQEFTDMYAKYAKAYRKLFDNVEKAMYGAGNKPSSSQQLVKQFASDIDRASKNIAKLGIDTSQYYDSLNNLKSLQDSILNAKPGSDAYNKMIEEYYVKLRDLNAQIGQASPIDLKSIEKANEVLAKLRTVQNPTQEVAKSIEDLERALEAVDGSSLDNVASKMTDLKTVTAGASKVLTTKIDTRSFAELHKQLDASYESFTRFVSKMKPSGVIKYREEIDQLSARFRELGSSQDLSGTDLDDLLRDFDNLRKRVEQTGDAGGNIIGKLQDRVKGFVTYLISSAVTMKIYNSLRQAISIVKELDAEIVNLRMVTLESYDSAVNTLMKYNEMAQRLGTTTADVSRSAVEWLRQGFSTAESDQLVQDSMVLSKVGFIESEEAAQALTAAIKGYDLAASDAISVIDKFTKVDQVAATSAGNLATALAKTAANAKVSGLALDEVVGYLAVVNETMQESGEETGTFMNTMLSRMGNIKASRLVDPETEEDLSNVESTLRGLGIALRDSGDNFRNFGDVLDDVAARWDTYSNVEQRAIAAAFAGTRQQTRFFSLMEGWEQAQFYITEATDSSGSAMEKFGAYTEGLEAQLNSLKAAWEGLVFTLVDSGIIEWFANAGKGLASFMGAAGGLPTYLVAFEGLSLAVGGFAKSIGTFVKEPITNFIAGANKVKKAAVEAGTEIGAMGKAFGGLQGIGLGGFLNIATLVAGAIVSIVMAVRQAKAEALAAARESFATLRDNEKTLDDLKEKIVELKKELDNENISEDRSVEIRAELVSLQDQVIDLLGLEAQGFDVLKGSAQDAADAIENVTEQQKQNWLWEKQQTINDATRKNTREYSYSRDGLAHSVTLSSDQAVIQSVTADLQNWLNSRNFFSGRFTAASIGNKTGLWLDSLVGKGTHTNKELYDEFIAFRDYVNSVEEQYGIDLANLERFITGEVNNYKDKLETDGFDVFMGAGQRQVEVESNLSQVEELRDKVRSAVDEAIEQGTQNSVLNAENTLQDLLELVNDDETFGENQASAEAYIRDWISKIQSELDKQRVYVKLKPLIDNAKVKNPFGSPEQARAAVTLYQDAMRKNPTQMAQNIPGFSMQQLNFLYELQRASKDAGVDVDELISLLYDVEDATNEVTDSIDAEQQARDDLSKAIANNKDDYRDINNIIKAMSDGTLSNIMEEDANAIGNVIKKYPEMESILQSYADGTIDAATAQDYLMNAELSHFLDQVGEAYKDVLQAAADYGWQSQQVSSAMNALAALLPGVRTALYDDANGMWAISEAALQAAMNVGNFQSAIGTLMSGVSGLGNRGALQAKIDATTAEINNTIWGVSPSDQTRLKKLTDNIKSYQAQIDQLDTMANWSKRFENIVQDTPKDVKPSGSGGGGSSKDSSSSEKSEYEKLKESLDDYLKSREHYVKSLEREAKVFDKTESDHVNVIDNTVASMEEEIAVYRDMQDAITALIAKYNEMGLNDEAEQIIMELEDSWWGYEDTITSATDQIIASIDAFRTETNAAVDSIQNAYHTLKDAATEYAGNGYITIDTMQSILDLGVEYLSYLTDENEQLVLNRDRIQEVLNAKSQQLAVETAYNYVKKIEIAINKEDAQTLGQLIDATNTVTSATWDLVYANIKLLDLSKDQKAQVLQNVQALETLSQSMSTDLYSNDHVVDYYGEAGDALDTILKLTEDLIKHENEDMIEALDEQLDRYQKIINAKKESLQKTSAENQYARQVSDLVNNIAKLQNRIDILKLDTSREAIAERQGLEEQLMEQQNQLADLQADHALNAQLEALDEEEKAYSEQIDNEKKQTQQLVDSQEKLYQAAIARINGDWEGLYNDLIAYNREYGSMLEKDITDAWNKASEAVQRYGSFVEAVEQVGKQEGASIILNSGTSAESANSSGSVPSWMTDSTEMFHDEIVGYVNEMKENSRLWDATTDIQKRAELANENEIIAGGIQALTKLPVYRDENGVWWIGDEELYKKFRYHSGGVVGNQSNLKQNETLSLLEKGEMVLDTQKQSGLYSLVDFVSELSRKIDLKLKNINFGSISGLPFAGSSYAADATIGGTVWSPTINVAIQHSGPMTDTDAERYGNAIADTTLEKLKEGFTKRGISTTSLLKV